jgi:hypothetical protein
VEAQILIDGDLRMARRFTTRDLPLQWAGVEFESATRWRRCAARFSAKPPR